MKRIILATLLFFALAGPACGATYYVSPTGSNSNDGLGAGNDHAWLTIAKAETVAIAGDIVKILPGTYNEAVLFGTRSGSAGNMIRFEAADPASKPVISGAGKSTHTVEVWVDYVTFSDLIIRDAASSYNNLQIRGTANNIIFDRCEFYGAAGTTGHNICLIQTWNDITFNRCRSERAGGADVYMYGNASDAQAVTFNYSIIGGHVTAYGKTVVGSIQRAGADGVITININHSLVYGGNQYAIYTQTANTTVNIKNTIVMGGPMGVFPADAVIYTGTTSAYSIDHSLILGPPGGTYTSHYSTPGNVTEGEGVTKNSLPLFIRSNSPVQWFYFRHDDHNLAYWEAAAAVYESYGVRGTFFGDVSGMQAETNYAARLAALVNAGHDIGSHGWSHNRVVGATWGLSVQYTGAGASCALTISSNTFSTDCATPAHNVSYDLTSAAYDTHGEVAAALAATGNYSTNWNNADHARYLATSLADVAAQDIKTGAYQLLLDGTRLRSDETAKSKAWLETTIRGAGVTGWECKVWSYPFNEADDAFATAVKTSGYIGVTNGAAFTHSGTLEEVYVYRMAGAVPSPAWDATEANFRAATRAAIAGIQQSAMLGFINSHAATEASITELGWIIEELQKYGVTIRLLKDILTDVTTGGSWADADGDGTRWTRTLEDISDYRPRPGSPLINTGVAIEGLTTDFEGRPVPYSVAPTIGPYEYRPIGAVRR